MREIVEGVMSGPPSDAVDRLRSIVDDVLYVRVEHLREREQQEFFRWLLSWAELSRWQNLLMEPIPGDAGMSVSGMTPGGKVTLRFWPEGGTIWS